MATMSFRDAMFLLASITKVLSSWAMLIAVEEGIVSLDQPAGRPCGCCGADTVMVTDPDVL